MVFLLLHIWTDPITLPCSLARAGNNNFSNLELYAPYYGLRKVIFIFEGGGLAVILMLAKQVMKKFTTINIQI